MKISLSLFSRVCEGVLIYLVHIVYGQPFNGEELENALSKIQANTALLGVLLDGLLSLGCS